MNILKFLSFGLLGQGIKHEIIQVLTIYTTQYGATEEVSVIVEKKVWLPSQIRNGEHFITNEEHFLVTSVTHRAGKSCVITLSSHRIKVDLSHVSKSGWLDNAGSLAKEEALKNMPGWKIIVNYWPSTPITEGMELSHIKK